MKKENSEIPNFFPITKHRFFSFDTKSDEICNLQIKMIPNKRKSLRQIEKINQERKENLAKLKRKKESTKIKSKSKKSKHNQVSMKKIKKSSKIISTNQLKLKQLDIKIKKKKSSVLSPSKIFDIDNFIINSNSQAKLTENILMIKTVMVPKFREIKKAFFTVHKPNEENISTEEDTSDEYYIKFHDELEEIENMVKDSSASRKRSRQDK